MDVSVPNLPTELMRLLRQVPAGYVTTYGTLALGLGDRSATRWVASYLRHAGDPAEAPLQRVVRVDGTLTDDPVLAAAAKREKLLAEGVPVLDGKVQPVADYLFTQFSGERPLERLQAVQRQLASEVKLTPLVGRPRQIAAVDTSYSGGWGVATYALCDTASGELLWHATVRRREAFPYIPGYLTYRELPLLMELLNEVRRQRQPAEVLLVDGTGILHPRGIGIATQLGLTLDHPTIGVAKKLLYGRLLEKVEEPGEFVPVYDKPLVTGPATAPSKGGLVDEAQLGWAVRPVATNRGLLYVSPGHLTSLADARSVVASVLHGRRLPEPIYWADRLSRQAAQGKG